MSDIIEAYYEKLAAKGARGKMNLPALARRDIPFMECIQSDTGKLFISQDVVALEPSITAEMSGDWMYRYATLDSIGKRPFYTDDGVLMIDDIYLMSASQFPTTRNKMRDIYDNHTMPTGLSFADQWMIDSEICKDYTKKTVRNFAKVACLGIGYGMGYRKFQKTSEEAGVPISVGEAKETIAAYWRLFSGLAALRDTLSWEVKRKGSLVNPFGYRLTPQPHKALNAYIQSSASGVLDVYIMKLFAMTPYAEFVCLIHDEVVLQCPENKIKDFEEISRICIESLNKDLGWDTPIRFGTKIATTFAEIK